MVLSSVSSSQKPTSLSYAERAKKAHNIQSSNPPLPPTLRHIQPSSNITQNSNSSVANPPPLSGDKVILVTDANVSSDTTPSHHSSPSEENASDSKSIDGSSPATRDAGTKAPSTAATPIQKAPAVNFWQARKEKMAARSAPSNATTESQPILPNPKPSSITRNPTHSTAPTAPNAAHEPKVVNSVTLLEAKTEDPFVVRIPPHHKRVNIPTPAPLPADSWPEVGKTLSTTTIESSPPAKGESAKSNGTEVKQSVTSKKSEKPKWVPIPAEELQAAADAILKSSRSRSRKSSQHASQPSSRNTKGNSPGQPSGSGHGRPYSGQNSLNHSASHSTAQSRSESVQSSPQLPRGRRLPGEDKTFTENPIEGDQRTTKTSVRQHSPSQPPNQLNSNPAANIDSSPSNPISSPTYPNSSGLHLPANGNLPFITASPAQNMAYYAKVNDHHSHTYNNQHGSSSVPPQPVASSVYPNAPSYQHYQTFPPYDYKHVPPSTPPYVNWHEQGHPSSGQHSPAYPPSSSTYHPIGLPTHIHQQFSQPYLNGHVPSVPTETEFSFAVPTTRMPPSEQSEAVAGHKAAKLSNTTGTSTGKIPPVVFGSIGIPGASASPAPASPKPKEAETMADDLLKPFTTFSIGVDPEEKANSAQLRSRIRTSKVRSKPGSDAEGEATGPSEENGETGHIPSENITRSTVPEVTKWEFGTTSMLNNDVDSAQPNNLIATPTTEISDGRYSISNAPPTSIAGPEQSQISGIPSTQNDPPPPVVRGIHLAENKEEDEFEVKDFGYGFGPASGTGYGHVITRAERLARQREREREKVAHGHGFDVAERKGDMDAQGELPREDMSSGRPRRGSFHGGGYIHERGGYSGRRGRGVNSFGRGYNRNYNRGGYQAPNNARQSGYNMNTPPHFQPVMPIASPPNGYYPPPRQQLTTYIPTPYDGYQVPAMIPPPQLNPPVPVPLTTVPFPLDSTRWYLLGQLEYYLSPQNMAQDLFLRRRMDSHGWIPINLLASFNRVRRLTVDVQLVKDVLTLSSLVQLKDDWVRMGGWESFVLPDAVPSVVEGTDQEYYQGQVQGQDELSNQSLYSHLNGNHIDNDAATYESNYEGQSGGQRGADMSDAYMEGEGEFDGDGEIDDDDEEDVVFVMGEGAERWTPERHS